MGKKRGPNIIMTFLTAVIAISAVLVCISPYLPLKEGSLPYAVLNPVHDLFDRYVNVFADASLRVYGLIPVTALCLVNFILALMGSGLIQFLLRCTAFYGAYLVGTYFQGRNPIFEIQLQLPDFYPYVAAAYVVVSLLLLFLIHRVKKGSDPKAAAVAQDQPSQEFVREDINDTSVVRDEAETSQEPEEDTSEVPAQEIPRVREPSDPILSRKAMESLVSVHAPEYQSFPNYTSGSTISSVDRGIYDVAEREARIRKEEQMRREAELERRRKQAEEEERARKEEEEARQRLQNMFKPRNLMKRLNEDAMAALHRFRHAREHSRRGGAYLRAAAKGRACHPVHQPPCQGPDSDVGHPGFPADSDFPDVVVFLHPGRGLPAGIGVQGGGCPGRDGRAA